MAVTRNRPAGPASRMRVAADLVDDWREQAHCRSYPDPDLWYPLSYKDDAVQKPRNECARHCPIAVRIRCLTWALNRGEREGVWAGTVPAQRSAIRATGMTAEQAVWTLAMGKDLPTTDRRRREAVDA